MNYLAIDTETHLFGEANKAPRVVCLSWARGAASGLFLRGDGAKFLFENLVTGAVIVGHNIAYDAACLMASVPELAEPLWRAYNEGRVHCTRAREKLLDIARGNLRFRYDDDGELRRAGYGLAELSQRLLKTEMSKEDSPRLHYAKLDGIPLEQWTDEERAYPVKDAKATLQLALSQDIRAAKMNYTEFERESARQAQYDLALYLTTCWGLAVDRKRARELREYLAKERDRLYEQLRKTSIFKITGTKSMAAIRGMVTGAWPGNKPPRTDKGAIRTDRETLEACASAGGIVEDHPLDLLVRYNRVDKMLSTYVDRLINVGVVHPEYDLAATGRTTCRSPNIQNQPRTLKGSEYGIRECFVARPGHVLISVDYDSQELRTLAQVLRVVVGRSTLAERYKKDPGYDPHLDFAAQLLGISYKEAQAGKKNDKKIKEMRQRSKAANFGFPGGMGADNFRLYARGYGLELSAVEAQTLRDRWFQQWPEMQNYFVFISKMTDGAGDVYQLYSGRKRGGCGFSDGANTYFQGLAADASKSALYEVAARCYDDPSSPLYGARPVAFIHDEIILEALEESAHEAAEELVKVMVEAMQKWTPDVPSRASPALMRHWSKEADEARDTTGRLIPWEDRQV